MKSGLESFTDSIKYAVCFTVVVLVFIDLYCGIHFYSYIAIVLCAMIGVLYLIRFISSINKDDDE
jgi:hypothetical protein